MSQLRYTADKDGQTMLASATKRADGQPRFVMPILASMIESDNGISYLVRHEVLHEGFLGADPIAVKVDDMRVALRRSEAMNVILAPEAA